MSDSFSRLSERIKDEVGGVARKLGLLEGWIQFRQNKGHPIIPVQPFLLESVRNAHELLVLKIFHLLDANEADDVCLLRFQRELETRMANDSSQIHEVTQLGRQLKKLRKSGTDTTKNYRDRHVAHPNILVEAGPDLKDIRSVAIEIFALVETYQKHMVGGLNYEAEVAWYRDSFLSALHSTSVNTARLAISGQSP